MWYDLQNYMKWMKYFILVKIYIMMVLSMSSENIKTNILGFQGQLTIYKYEGWANRLQGPSSCQYAHDAPVQDSITKSAILLGCTTFCQITHLLISFSQISSITNDQYGLRVVQ